MSGGGRDAADRAEGKRAELCAQDHARLLGQGERLGLQLLYDLGGR